MMKFAKMEGGILKRCPKTGISGKSLHTNLSLYYSDNPAVALTDGWKELVETERPDGYCQPAYTETDTQIIRQWVSLPESEPTPDPLKELMNEIAVLTDAILEMSEQVYA